MERKTQKKLKKLQKETFEGSGIGKNLPEILLKKKTNNERYANS